jgi:hypothetical protein
VHAGLSCGLNAAHPVRVRRSQSHEDQDHGGAEQRD